MGFFDHAFTHPERMEELPGQSIIEISGGCRVLIEGHGGVKAYSREKIVINTKNGMVCLCGCGMEIIRMTRERMVIQGRIDSINLLRR